MRDAKGLNCHFSNVLDGRETSFSKKGFVVFFQTQFEIHIAMTKLHPHKLISNSKEPHEFFK